MKWNAMLEAEPAGDPLQAGHRVRRLRWLMLLLALAMLAGCALDGLALPWPLVGQALATLALVNLALPRLPGWGLKAESALRLGLFFDVLVLTELLAFSGGAANPLASLYLPPVLFAALLSPGWFAWLLALLSVSAYGLLFEWHLDWPLNGGNAAYAFNLHLSGMWFSFALSALLIAGFVSRLARQLRHQGDALAEARETQLRDEQLLAVGMQAAGAAHSLSTPLNTLTLLVDELLGERHGDEALRQDLLLMRAQLGSCRSALARLKHGSEPSPGPQPLFAALAERLEGWRSLRPDLRLDWRAPDGDDPPVRLDAAFWPALFNLVNNAAEAGGGAVEVTARLDGRTLSLDIVNRQGCLSGAQLARAGLAPLESAKPAGLGLGMLLSHATLARLGGTLSLDNRADGGVRARIELPLGLEDGQ
ncbi:ATP-binding protein [Chromobacterium sp. ATCC 53434]|uniref:ATP-binding protein n=1 Tax=Chromobacterium sp. (strain ATCC 53434 / SC 14030) TaxID=2059672 RepID=UPI001F15791F|nr:ATP-binding protein [Chromobacterium sp. ATCC 53434]